MINEKEQKRGSLNKDVVLLIKGLIIGKVLTLVVVGGLLWWLRPRLLVSNVAPSNQTEVATTNSKASQFQTIDPVPTGSFRYGGSTAWAPIRQLVDAQIQNTRPELQLRYANPANRSPSSRSGIEMLLNGQLDIAQSSRPLTAAETAMAKQRGFSLEQRVVGVDGVAVVVNPSLEVAGLTTEQLQQIYQGKITNWQQVGGPDLPIVPFSRRLEDVDAQILATDEAAPQLGPQVQYVSTTTQALRQLSQTPGGVYYASARAVVPQCSVKPLPLGRSAEQLISPYQAPLAAASDCPDQRHQPNTAAFENGDYPITYNLYVIIKQNQGREQQAGEAYADLLLSQQGQRAIAQAGFAPRPEALASQ